MNVPDLITLVTDTIRPQLSDEYRLVLFGSWAKDSARPQSDIDIGILGNQPVPWSTMAAIRQSVEDLPTLRRIDVVDLQTVDTDFKKAVLAYATML